MGRPKKNKNTTVNINKSLKISGTLSIEKTVQEIKEYERWIDCLERSIKYSEEHDLKDNNYHYIRNSLAKAKGRKIYLESLVAKGEEDETK